MTELLSTTAILTVLNITIAIAIFMVLLIVSFILGKTWERRNQSAAHMTARWFKNKYAEAERENGLLHARLNIIKQAVSEEI